jgi:hypothetical protein
MYKNKLMLILFIFIGYNIFPQNTPERILNAKDYYQLLINAGDINDDLLIDTTEDYHEAIRLYLKELITYIEQNNLREETQNNDTISNSGIITNYYAVLNREVPNSIEKIFLKYDIPEGHKIYFVHSIGGSLLYAVFAGAFGDIDIDLDNFMFEYYNKLIPLPPELEIIKQLIHPDDLLMIQKGLTIGERFIIMTDEEYDEIMEEWKKQL